MYTAVVVAIRLVEFVVRGEQRSSALPVKRQNQSYVSVLFDGIRWRDRALFCNDQSKMHALSPCVHVFLFWSWVGLAGLPHSARDDTV